MGQSKTIFVHFHCFLTVFTEKLQFSWFGLSAQKSSMLTNWPTQRSFMINVFSNAKVKFTLISSLKKYLSLVLQRSTKIVDFLSHGLGLVQTWVNRMRLRSDREFFIWARFMHALNWPILLRFTRSVWTSL